MKLRSSSFGLPASGKSRSEDAFAISPQPDGGLLCVLSDGVGAARDPLRAAERVVRLISEGFEARPNGWPLRKVFERLVDEANASLYREGAYLDGVPSMQATLAAVFVNENRLCGFNVGDSPILLVREGNTVCLSQTHSCRNADGNDVLTNAVGMGTAVTGHYFETDLSEGDVVVITSDGLPALMDIGMIGKLAGRFGSARTLIHEALQENVSADADDLTVVLLEVKELSQPEGRTLAAGPCRPPLGKGVEIDGFKLLRPLGGNENVWLAEKEARRFVLKFLPGEAERDESGNLHARFAREAGNACRLRAPYFVTATMPESGAAYYYVQDYVDAPTISALLKSKRLAVDEAIELGRFLSRAGQWLLGHELVHGDIKPENILFVRTPDGEEFKLLDLGLASTVFTDTGRSGTPTYLAPERFEGAVVTERTEIFAIGVTLFEALTGRLPFGRIERFQTPIFHPAQRPSRWNPNVPPWLDAVILKCLSLRSDRRFQHFSELLFALEHPASAPADSFEPLFSRNPTLFYKAGFWLLLAVCLVLLWKVLS
ncbi:serine/threonine protein phosphatase [Spartobacteria bacterium LR76]|nr:serine/threonine protein phosphatase [Spartobacteria bacterium LR76]